MRYDFDYEELEPEEWESDRHKRPFWTYDRVKTVSMIVVAYPAYWISTEIVRFVYQLAGWTFR